MQFLPARDPTQLKNVRAGWQVNAMNWEDQFAIKQDGLPTRLHETLR